MFIVCCLKVQWLFPVIDSNKDGIIDLNEAATYLNKAEEIKGLKSGEYPQWFKQMDTNSDGKLQPLELDKDYHYDGSEDIAVKVAEIK